MNQDRLGVAVVGCGGISRVHLEALSRMDDVRIVAVCDIKKEKADAAAAKYAAEAVYDWRELVGRADIRCVHMCTPHHLHALPAIEFLKAGQWVLTEKPMAHCEEDMNALVAADNGRLGVIFQNRYNASSQAARETIESGRLGALKGMRGCVYWKRDEKYYTESGWRGAFSTEGGGVMINQAIHTLDEIQWLGGPVESISGAVSQDHLAGIIEVEDNAHAFIRFKSGVTAVFFASTAHVYDAPIEVELVFEKGILIQRGDELFENVGGNITQITKKPEIDTVGKSYWGTGHAAQIRDYYDCMKANKPFWINAAEGAKALRLLLWLYKSSKEGRAQTVGV